MPCSENLFGQRSFSRSAFLPGFHHPPCVSPPAQVSMVLRNLSVFFSGKSSVSVLQGWSHPMTRAGARLSFLVPAAGRSHRGPEHHWTGGHVRATCGEASWPLGGPQDLPLRRGVWGGGVGPSASSGPPLLHGMGHPSSPSVLVQGSVSLTLWLPVGASSFPPHIRHASLPYRGT